MTIDYALKLFNLKLLNVVKTVKIAHSVAVRDEKYKRRKNGISPKSVNNKSKPPGVSQVAELFNRSKEQFAADNPISHTRVPNVRSDLTIGIW